MKSCLFLFLSLKPFGAPITEAKPETSNPGFFINNGTFSGRFSSPAGQAYTIRKLEPREVKDPRTGEVTTIWGGYVSARDIEVAAKDNALQTEFKKTGKRPAELFAPKARDIPLYLTLRPHAGKSHTCISAPSGPPKAA